MSPEDLRVVFYAVALIALTVSAVYFLVRYGAPNLYRRARNLEPTGRVLAGALVIVAGLGLFPPWNFTFQTEYAARSVRPAPRALLFFPPSPMRGNASYGVAIDLSRLAIEWLVVGSLASALLIVFRLWRPWVREDSERTELPSDSAVPAPISKSVRPEVVEELVRETPVRLAPIGAKQSQFLAAIAKLRGAGATPEEIERFKESFKKD